MPLKQNLIDGENVMAKDQTSKVIKQSSKKGLRLLIANQGFLRAKFKHELKHANERLHENRQRISELLILNQELIVQSIEKEKHIVELILINKELVFQRTNVENCVAELTIVDKNEECFQVVEKGESRDQNWLLSKEYHFAEITTKMMEITAELIFQNAAKEKCAAELEIALQKLAFQNTEKEARAAELEMMNLNLITEYDRNQKTSQSLIIANRELFDQNAAKEACAAELLIANKELAFQYSEKEARADELLIINQELAFQIEERNQRTIELMMAHKRIAAVNEDFLSANEELILQTIESEKRVLKLTRSYHENRILNEQVNHMQKLESIGRLTSGVAHDFNNILGCILGYNEMNQESCEDIQDEVLKAEILQNTKQVDIASKRAIVLIDKMMTYSRQDTIKKTMDVKPTIAVIEEVLMMLRPALTSRIKIQTSLECAENIQIDAIDLHQILTNLAVNARDAMKERGGIIIVSLNIFNNVKPHCVACAGKMSGDFIELSVSDNGTGIESDVISRMFDPFFTTKKQGEGTGLGLSTVSGMVHRSQGHILVDSNTIEPNQGTSFKLLFPIVPVI